MPVISARFIVFWSQPLHLDIFTSIIPALGGFGNHAHDPLARILLLIPVQERFGGSSGSWLAPRNLFPQIRALREV